MLVHHWPLGQRERGRRRGGNFSPAQIACRGTGQLKLHAQALDKLQALRDRLGKPLIVRNAQKLVTPDQAAF